MIPQTLSTIAFCDHGALNAINKNDQKHSQNRSKLKQKSSTNRPRTFLGKDLGGAVTLLGNLGEQKGGPEKGLGDPWALLGAKLASGGDLE